MSEQSQPVGLSSAEAGGPEVGDPNARTRPGKDPDASDGNPAAPGDAAQPYGPTETDPA
jgi:hypothetical protein